MKRSLPSTSSLETNIIIPLAGYTDSLHDQLQSIVSQTYPYSRLICVTENRDDKAVPVILKLMKRDPRIIHVCAGRAISSSQKNQNLLAGLEHLTDDCDILVFCDGGHIAPQNWLRNLLKPFKDDELLTASSGYHHIYPALSGLAIYCRAVCVATLHLLRRFPFIHQPWGGASAVRLKDFQAMDVASTWGSTIVDDVTLARLLQLHGKKLAVPVDADTRTYINSGSFSTMISWLIRQIAYLKFVFPLTWAILGIALFLLSVGFFSSIMILTMKVLSDTPSQGDIFSLFYLAFFFFFCFTLRRSHPSPGTAVSWYTGCLLCAFLACWCHAKTWLTSKVHWGDTTYTVRSKGAVIHIERTKFT